jgi:hypothetical protein
MSPMVVQLVSAGSFCGWDRGKRPSETCQSSGASTRTAPTQCSAPGHHSRSWVERQGGVGLSAVTAAGNTSRTNR